MVICNFVLPLIILSNPRTRSIVGCVIASAGVVVGMWLERFLIVVPSLTHKQLPYSWGTYSPTPVEIAIMAATFAAMVLLYALFAKFVPIISIWEMKAGDFVHSPKAGVVAADPHRIDIGATPGGAS
jgi:molybdopterin-containing oxidoreductase family membrane subunit